MGEFEKAAPLTPEVDVSRLIKAKIHTGPYRVVSGDVLEFQMRTILRVISSDLPDSLQKVEPYLCRVSDAGTITLPIVGEMPVAGRKLAEVESSVVDAYFPKYVVNLPTVVCIENPSRVLKGQVLAPIGDVRIPLYKHTEVML